MHKYIFLALGMMVHVSYIVAMEDPKKGRLINLVTKTETMKDQAKDFAETIPGRNKGLKEVNQDLNLLQQELEVLAQKNEKLERLAQQSEELKKLQGTFEKFKNDSSKKNLPISWLNGLFGSMFFGAACYLGYKAWGSTDYFYKYSFYTAALGTTCLAGGQVIQGLDKQKQCIKEKQVANILGGFFLMTSLGGLAMKEFNPLKHQL